MTTLREAKLAAMGATPGASPRILFLDDVRYPAAIGLSAEAADITVVRSCEAAIEAVQNNPKFDLWFLDHDLGLVLNENSGHDPSLITTATELPHAKTGYDFLRWAAEHGRGKWPWNRVHVHSMNIVGKRRMMNLILDVERGHFGVAQ